MAGPGLPTSIDSTYEDSGTDPSVQAHQQHHDAGHAILNHIDKDTLPSGDAQVWASLSGVMVPRALTSADVGVAADQVWAPTSPYPNDRPDITVISEFQSGHGWSLTNGDGTSDINYTGDPILGSQYAKVVTTGVGSGTPARLTKSGISPTLDFTGKQFWLLCRVTNRAYLANIQFFAGNTSFTAYYYFEFERYMSAAAGTWMNEGEWTWQKFSFVHNTTTTGTPPLSAITDLRMTIVDSGSAGVGKVTLDIAALGYSPNDVTTAWPNGVVSFTFDDGYDVQYSLAKPILDGYLMPATAFLIADQIGAAGFMTLAQAQELQNVHGWEMCGHSSTLALHNTSGALSTLTEAQLDAEFATMKKWLRDNDLYSGKDTYAYPIGTYNPTIIKHARKFFSCAAATSTFGQEVYPPPDRMRIRRFFLGSGAPLATVEQYVDRAYANGGWLVIGAHKLGASADSSTWVTADFQSLVDYIAAKPMPVATVGQVMANRGKAVLAALPTQYPSFAKAKAMLSLSAIIQQGAAAIANNVLPPGIVAGFATTLNSVVVRCGTGPVGSVLTVKVRQNNSIIQTVSVADGGTTASVTGLTTAVAAGDVFTFDITAVGSGTAGSNIAVDLLGT